jgi:hypothetical protein
MAPTDSIPPEDASTRIRLEALTLTVQALVALLLPLEGAVRELLGEVRAERAARLAASAQAAQPHPLSVALADALRTDPSARRLAGFGLLLLGAALGILALSGVSAEPGTAAGAIIAVVDHHLPGGSP